jgi:DNA-binding CsgD family transcriptional regulator
MTVVPQRLDPANVFVVGPDATVREAIARLLALEPSLHIAGTAHGIEDVTTADVVIDERLLHDLRNLTIADFIDMVKTLPVSVGKAHLRPLPGGERDMRTLLSDRELQVVRLVAEGISNKEISTRLALSDKTVKNHISHILAKLNLSARTQIAVHAIRAGIV